MHYSTKFVNVKSFDEKFSVKREGVFFDDPKGLGVFVMLQSRECKTHGISYAVANSMGFCYSFRKEGCYVLYPKQMET